MTQENMTSMPAYLRWLRLARPHWWLAAMLLTLHYALAWGIDDAVSRVLLLAHFGFFLIWQPVWRGEREIALRHAVLVGIVAVLFIGWVNWWAVVIWLTVLFALIGGNLSGARGTRRIVSLIAGGYLLALLLLWAVPHTFTTEQLFFDPGVMRLVRYGLPLLPALILFIPVSREQSPLPLAVDLFYSMLLFLLVAGLVLGSYVVKEVGQHNYGMALAESLIAMALLLLLLSWLWNPRSGFAGIGYLMSRYLLSLGLPFERWVGGLAELAEHEPDAESFLSRALYSMRELPWLAGTAWHSARGAGAHDATVSGEHTNFRIDYAVQDVQLTFYTRWALSPALLLHLKLLTQILGHFYEAKQREEQLRQSAYTQAIHETGARLTHDVKNLLQALRSLCAVLETNANAGNGNGHGNGGNGNGKNGDANALIQRQLPQITQRLATTLEKLNAPAKAVIASPDIHAEVWWLSLQQRYMYNDIEFRTEGVINDAQLPGELFDGVAENLLQNALTKKMQHHNLRVIATLRVINGDVRFSVSDDGNAVPPQIAARLLVAPVPSQNGLGIGLYQAARHAEQAGYQLTLANNADGRVVFELRKA